MVLATSNFGKGPYSRLEVTQRSFVLSDFLLFSEHSLNYLQEVELSVPQQNLQYRQADLLLTL